MENAHLISSSSACFGTPSGLFWRPDYGNLKASYQQSFFIKAVLEERSRAPIITKESRFVNEQMMTIGGRKGRAQLPLEVQREGAAENEMGMEDGEPESTWVHRIWVATGNAAMVGTMVKAMEAYTGTSEETLGVIVSAIGAYILADFATGLYHWGIDNYGNAHTPIFGSHIDAFQGHHKRPWVIATGQFANNIHRQARPATFFLSPFLLLPSHPYFHSFLALFTAFVVYSQQFHAWVHAKQKDVPPLVLTLQDMGLLLSRKMHGTHHRPPYNVNYCIVSGLCNPLLDHVHFFATLENLIFITCRVRPRSWTETSVDWLQIGSYFADGTDMDDTSTL